ncbi:hypothetical protein LOAG_11280 [Loa loa]|uniref:Uncharacterized protein n=1 Tax=Loa loa TaxID=7209 RepID=A0A1S0TPR1_LOALO|nr:hypothetical protein LOAG_11280 [Loa loa]EFO17219.1 hypothetical protein LOAG_11280 [Loa loa]
MYREDNQRWTTSVADDQRLFSTCRVGSVLRKIAFNPVTIITFSNYKRKRACYGERVTVKWYEIVVVLVTRKTVPRVDKKLKPKSNHKIGHRTFLSSDLCVCETCVAPLADDECIALSLRILKKIL